MDISIVIVIIIIIMRYTQTQTYSHTHTPSFHCLTQVTWASKREGTETARAGDHIARGTPGLLAVVMAQLHGSQRTSVNPATCTIA